jgi:hypothetical protein
MVRKISASWPPPAAPKIRAEAGKKIAGPSERSRKLTKRDRSGAKIIFLSNVRDHRHRTAGAPDAGEERASASGVTAGRCSVHRSVRTLVPSTLDIEPWSASSSCFLSIPTRDGGSSLVSPCRIGIHSESRPFKPATHSCQPSVGSRSRALFGGRLFFPR